MTDILILSGPSGVGKTTVANEIIRQSPYWKKVITCTTRNPRASETEQDYKFLTNEDFEDKLKKGCFLESAVVYGRNYGTLKSDFESVHNTHSVIFVVSYSGMVSIKEKYPEALSVFLCPPTQEDLCYRIQNRGEIDKSGFRLNPEIEMKNAIYYDHVVVNSELETTVNNILQLL